MFERVKVPKGLVCHTVGQREEEQCLYRSLPDSHDEMVEEEGEGEEVTHNPIYKEVPNRRLRLLETLIEELACLLFQGLGQP